VETEYRPHVIEPKWQEVWRTTHLYRVVEDPARPKYYNLEMFPYRSGISTWATCGTTAWAT